MKKNIVFLLFFTLLLTACNDKTYEPKEISVETDICEICKMSVTHMQFAGQIVFKNNDHLVFDDIGCLMEYVKEYGEENIGAAFIKDETNAWINVKEAVYIYNSNFWTPMNYGVLAFSNMESANTYMEQNGKGNVLNYDDLKTFNWGIHTEL